MSSSTDKPARLIGLAGTVNFRDIGGYPNADGRSVKWETLFRADSLNRLTSGDHAEIRRLGIATVIDLRTTAEVEEGHFDAEATPVDFLHLPLMESVPDPEAFRTQPGLLSSTYVEMLDTAGAHVVRAIEALASPGGLPAIVHCTAGKDRTGVLIALVLGLLGVDDELIVEDYALSAASMHQLKERLAERYPDAADEILEDDEVFSAAPENMEHLLTTITARWGSTEALAIDLGISEQTIAQLRAALLEPLR